MCVVRTVQIPLHADLPAALRESTPYEGGFYFGIGGLSRLSTPQGNFGLQIAKVFRSCGIDSDVHHVSHASENLFPAGPSPRRAACHV